MLPSFIIGTITKTCSQLNRTTINSTQKTFERHKRPYFAKITSQTLQIAKIVIPIDTMLLSKQMLSSFYIDTIAKRRLQIIRTALNSNQKRGSKVGRIPPLWRVTGR